MENFFYWMSKILPQDEVEVWFNVNNMYYEKIDLYGDICKSLNQIIMDTYLGEGEGETKIQLQYEDKLNHFEWCWKKLISDFKKENIHIKKEGELKDYFKDFFFDGFYNQNQKNVRLSIPHFINDVFDHDKNFTKSDLDILTELYKLIDRNIDLK